MTEAGLMRFEHILQLKDKNIQSNSVIKNSVITNTAPGYSEQNEHNWLVSVNFSVHFLDYNEQNPVITNNISLKLCKS